MVSFLFHPFRGRKKENKKKEEEEYSHTTKFENTAEIEFTTYKATEDLSQLPYKARQLLKT